MPLAVTVNCFGTVAAVDLGGVDAGAALDQVAAVARIPDDAVVAGSPKSWSLPVPPISVSSPSPPDEDVVTAVADEGVVAGAAEELICARAAGQHVVAVAAEQWAAGSAPLVSSSEIVSSPFPAEHLDLGGVGDRRLAAVDGYGAAVDEDLPGRVAADRDGVAEVVAGLLSASRWPGQSWH